MYQILFFVLVILLPYVSYSMEEKKSLSRFTINENYWKDELQLKEQMTSKVEKEEVVNKLKEKVEDLEVEKNPVLKHSKSCNNLEKYFKRPDTEKVDKLEGSVDKLSKKVDNLIGAIGKVGESLSGDDEDFYSDSDTSSTQEVENQERLIDECLDRFSGVFVKNEQLPLYATRDELYIVLEDRLKKFKKDLFCALKSEILTLKQDLYLDLNKKIKFHLNPTNLSLPKNTGKALNLMYTGCECIKKNENKEKSVEYLLSCIKEISSCLEKRKKKNFISKEYFQKQIESLKDYHKKEMDKVNALWKSKFDEQRKLISQLIAVKKIKKSIENTAKRVVKE